MPKAHIAPIILAAGPGVRDLFRAHRKRQGRLRPPRLNPFEVALANCRGLAPPLLVLGSEAGQLRKYCPAGAQVVVHRGWRRGQLSSLLAGLDRVPGHLDFMVYPVDLVRLKRSVIRSLQRAFDRRQPGQEIFMPCFRSRPGHPVIFARAIGSELRGARTARDVVYSDPRRLVLVPVRSDAIWQEGRRK